MYLEVHTLASALSIGAVWRPKHSKCHECLIVFSSRLPRKREVLDPLMDHHKAAQRLGKSPQLNWRLPRNLQKGLTLEEYLQINWRPQENH
jgi:hypothetical protein